MLTAMADVVMRVVHIVCAMVVVVGVAVVPLVIRPALNALEETHREAVLRMVDRRLRMWLWIGVAGLVVSGVYNWIGLAATYEAIGPVGNAMIGIKVLLAFMVFALMAVRQAAMLGPRADRPLLMLIVHLTVVVLAIASVLRHLRLA